MIIGRICALCLLLVLVACGDKDDSPTKPTSPPASGPERVVETLMKALEDGDCEVVKRVVVTPSAIDCAQVTEAAGMLVLEGVDPDQVRYESGTIAGDSATVTITWSKDLPPEPIDVQRVDGDWLVVFDSSP